MKNIIVNLRVLAYIVTFYIWIDGNNISMYTTVYQPRPLIIARAQGVILF